MLRIILFLLFIFSDICADIPTPLEGSIFFSAEGASLLGGGGSKGMPVPPEKCSNLISLRWHFLHLTSIFWYSIRSLLLSQISLIFSMQLLIHHCRVKKEDIFYYFYVGHFGRS